ncbi:MAG: hypothetical protein M3198_02885 [Actinomycetota bacterium]|nr:hypothetical protein [Actinomycetota bacterium]
MAQGVVECHDGCSKDYVLSCLLGYEFTQRGRYFVPRVRVRGGMFESLQDWAFVNIARIPRAGMGVIVGEPHTRIT